MCPSGHSLGHLTTVANASNHYSIIPPSWTSSLSTQSSFFFISISIIQLLEYYKPRAIGDLLMSKQPGKMTKSDKKSEEQILKKIENKIWRKNSDKNSGWFLWISPLAVFVKYDQLYFSKAPNTNSILLPECPKGKPSCMKYCLKKPKQYKVHNSVSFL